MQRLDIGDQFMVLSCYDMADPDFSPPGPARQCVTLKYGDAWLRVPPTRISSGQVPLCRIHAAAGGSGLPGRQEPHRGDRGGHPPDPYALPGAPQRVHLRLRAIHQGFPVLSARPDFTHPGSVFSPAAGPETAGSNPPSRPGRPPPDPLFGNLRRSRRG